MIDRSWALTGLTEALKAAKKENDFVVPLTGVMWRWTDAGEVGDWLPAGRNDLLPPV